MHSVQGVVPLAGGLKLRAKPQPLTLLCHVLEALLNPSAALDQEERSVLEHCDHHLTVQSRLPVIDVQVQHSTQQLNEGCVCVCVCVCGVQVICDECVH